jgi:four helix bundle protein
MKFNRFEEILAWQKARALIVTLYKEFKYCKDFAFKDQILRASVSIMNNVAEGFERKSNNEFKQFLFISKGSCGEVRSMLILAEDLDLIEKNICQKCIAEAEEISKMLSGLIKSL